MSTDNTEPTNQCVVPDCVLPPVNPAVATCQYHICPSCFEHPGSKYLTKIELGEKTFDVKLCPQCLMGMNSGMMEVKEGVDYLAGLRNAEHI